MKVKVMKHNIHNDAIRWQKSKSIKVILCIFSLALTIFEVLTFGIFYLENLGQRQGVIELQMFECI